MTLVSRHTTAMGGACALWFQDRPRDHGSCAARVVTLQSAHPQSRDCVVCDVGIPPFQAAPFDAKRCAACGVGKSRGWAVAR